MQLFLQSLHNGFNDLNHKHMGTTPQAEMSKLHEPLLPWRGVLWIYPDVHPSVPDSLSARPNGSLPASSSSQPLLG